MTATIFGFLSKSVQSPHCCHIAHNTLAGELREGDRKMTVQMTGDRTYWIPGRRTRTAAWGQVANADHPPLGRDAAVTDGSGLRLLLQIARQG